MAMLWVRGFELAGLVAMLIGGTAAAQVVGPPIPPDQVLRQQNQPLPPPPTIPVPVQPAPPIAGAPASPQVRTRDPARDRAAWCQHQATVERIPASQRSSYIHHCIMGP